MFTPISVSTFIIHYVDTFVKLYLKILEGRQFAAPTNLSERYLNFCYKLLHFCASVL